MTTLGERVILARKRIDINQSELARRVNVQQATISKIELGGSKSSALLVKIAMVCGVRPEWLQTGEGEMVAEKKVTIEDTVVAVAKLILETPDSMRLVLVDLLNRMNQEAAAGNINLKLASAIRTLVI